MAVAGTNNECIYADIGANSRCSNKGIWTTSNLEDWKRTGRKYFPDSWSTNVDEQPYYKTICNSGYGLICTKIMPHETSPANRADCGGMYLRLQTQQDL